ncbi:MAG: tetratricopeptide repeat protein, partial [Pontibacterium sp.]
VLLHFLALISLEHAVFNESEQLFTMLEPLEENPNRSRFYLGVIAQQQELFDKAVSRFDLVDPKSTYYIASLARISSILDSPEDQEDIDQRFTKALTLRPDLEPDLFAIHAEWQKKHGFTDESLALLDFALAKHPDDIDLRYTRALQLESINFDGTVRDLKHIIALENNNATALNALGYTMLLHTNRYQEAFDYISRALKASPDDVSIIDSMGWAHHKLGNYDKALEYLERAYSISQDEEIASHLIQSLWSTGQTERAQQLLKESLQKSPDNKHLIEAAKQLETS